MAIYYNILYPPLVPLTHPAFELTKPSDTFRLFLQPSVGNQISDFKGGFIRIRNADTEKNILLPVGDGYLDGFLPFRNPFAEYTDLVDPSKNIRQPDGFQASLPRVEKDRNDQYYIDIKQDVFLRFGASKDIRYKMQVMLTTDWVSSTLPDGRGGILTYDQGGYQRIDKNDYFGGNLVSKGLSEWSTNSLISPVSTANYQILFDGDNIFSPIFEFVGSSVEENIRNNSTANYLKAYRINVFRAFGEIKDILVDTSGWIIGQEASNLEIRWQNITELENKNKYIIELDIQTAWDLRKTFTYMVSTSFEDSLFRGNVSVINDHDNARSKIKLNIQTPLQWGPKDNFDISVNDREFATINGEASVIEGVDLFNSLASISGEMIVSGIKPIRTWEDRENRWFFKLAGPTISTINPIQEEYMIYAHSVPIGRSQTDSAVPYEDDILINPIIESPDGKVYATYLDSGKRTGRVETGGIVTHETDLPSSHTFFYLEDENRKMWRTTLTGEGEFATMFSHEKDPTEFLKPIGFHDPFTNTLAMPKVSEFGEITLKGSVYSDYAIGDNVRPMYVNEFRLVKRVYGLELGRKTLISKQTYKAFMTDFNRKLGLWREISEFSQYYIFFSSEKGQIRLAIRDINATETENALDRFTMTYTDGISARLGINSDMFLPTTGLDKDFLAIKNETGRELPYMLSSSEDGILFADRGFISSAGTSSRDLTQSEVDKLKSEGEIE